jgi:hypothetical protein
MPCHARSASVTPRRRPFPLRPPPVPLALLDLTKPAERKAHEYLTFATTGRDPSLRLLDVRRVGSLLLAAVVWVHRKEPAVIEVDLADSAGISLRWHYYLTTDLARAELNRRCSAVPGARP